MKKPFWRKPPKKKKRPKPVQKQNLPAVPKPPARPEEPWRPPYQAKPKTTSALNPAIEQVPRLGATSKNSPPVIDVTAKPVRPAKSNHKKEFLKTFNGLSYTHSAGSAWSDFVTIFACTISNSANDGNDAHRKALHLKLLGKYNKDEQLIFSKLAEITVDALEENPEQDFLGELFMELRLGNEKKGQIFTPYHVSQLMAVLTIGDLDKQIEKQGYVSINDPCCGAGAMLIAAANEAKKQLEKLNLNFQEHILVVGQDVDFTAAMMCYIQLSLLGIAGYVKVGNTLTEPMTSGDSSENYWFTPIYALGSVWQYRRIFEQLNALTSGVSSGNFQLGHIIVTEGVDEKMDSVPEFDDFVDSSLERFRNCDWGDMCDEDVALNKQALKSGEGRLHGEYTDPSSETKIWIITEGDRSVTTILLPEEY